MTKLLIVDDSALMRRQLVRLFEAEGDFEVRLARNGREAIEENLRFEPDVVTLDINMPEMDGLTALSQLMEERPVPVVMVSSLTEKGALATFEALALGAVDYVPKPGGTISLSIEVIQQELLSKVRGAARARLRTTRGLTARVRADRTRAKEPTARMPASTPKDGGASSKGVVLIGVSTGGPRTLEDILPRLPADFPWPVLVAQHMPASFTLPFANRMNELCELDVVEVSRPMVVERGRIYIAKGGADMAIVDRGGRPTAITKPETPGHLWHPSVELLGLTALEHYAPADILAVLLTGMGHDGADAFAEIHRRGGRTIAESEETAVVFGMPAELIARGGASLVMPSDRIAKQLLGWVR
jgi:two-component system chemotaxis response regulator CheB